MYWKQAIGSTLIGLIISGFLFLQGENPTIVIGVFAALYMLLRVLIATGIRTQYWLRKGGRRGNGQSCPECGQYIRRQANDWVLHCKRCGWTAGYPGLRWINHSVFVQQLQRSLTKTRTWGIVFSILLLGVGLTVPGGLAGVDLGSTDTDNDGLSDEIEENGETNGGYPLPNANPEQKDVFIRIYVADSVEPLSQQEKKNLKRIWGNMPVSNPDNTTGINAHITQVEMSRSIASNLSPEELREFEEDIYERRIPDAAQCSVYAVILADTPGGSIHSGLGRTPGYVSIVDGTEVNRYGTEFTVRTTVITHELLHNIVGEFEDGSAHTSEGWLNGAPETHGTNFFMSNKTATRLSTTGIATSEYYEQQVC